MITAATLFLKNRPCYISSFSIFFLFYFLCFIVCNDKFHMYAVYSKQRKEHKRLLYHIKDATTSSKVKKRSLSMLLRKESATQRLQAIIVDFIRILTFLLLLLLLSFNKKNSIVTSYVLNPTKRTNIHSYWNVKLSSIYQHQQQYQTRKQQLRQLYLYQEKNRVDTTGTTCSFGRFNYRNRWLDRNKKILYILQRNTILYNTININDNDQFFNNSTILNEYENNDNNNERSIQCSQSTTTTHMQQQHKQQRKVPKPQPISSDKWIDNKFPAKEFCSKCGLCETSFVQNVTSACAFLPQLGMNRISQLESIVHGRSRNINTIYWNTNQKNTNNNINDESRFGVLYEPIRLIKGISMPNSQWTGVVTSIAIAMLESNQVDAVVCIANNNNNNGNAEQWTNPEPIVARTVSDVLRGRGVKPALAPSLKVLDEIQNDTSIKRLLFCGVGCTVQAFRTIEKDLHHIESVYVIGTNCADNSPTSYSAEQFVRTGLNIDNNTVPSSQIIGYEFMQDYKVHVKTLVSSPSSEQQSQEQEQQQEVEYIKKPYFTLPGTIAKQSIAQSCLTCFDYTNACADVVIGYMGAPINNIIPMNESYQTLTIRNGKGKHMIQTALDLNRIHIGPIATSTSTSTDVPMSIIPFETLATATVNSDAIVQGLIDPTLVKQVGMPLWLGNIIASILQKIGPTGIDFARYSVDYHILRNYLYILNNNNNIKKKKQQRQGENSNTSSYNDDDDDENDSSTDEQLQLLLSLSTQFPPYVNQIVQQYLTNDKSFEKLTKTILDGNKEAK